MVSSWPRKSQYIPRVTFYVRRMYASLQPRAHIENNLYLLIHNIDYI